MIISVDTLQNVYGIFKDENTDLVKAKLDGLESLIRLYTNNNFQNRNIRIECPSLDNYLIVSPTHLKVGDTVQVSNSKINDGLYVIEEISSNKMRLDKDMYDCDYNMVTKVEYPQAVVSTLVNIMSWDEKYGSKMGIQSESIGRHSVSYFSQNDQNSLGGYPIHLFNPLKQFMMASRRY
ncbi:MAG: hypothetical protein SO292_04155 [Bacilli bacterium]|nr:hypothetical protein [Bacilli bacterium]